LWIIIILILIITGAYFVFPLLSLPVIPAEEQNCNLAGMLSDAGVDPENLESYLDLDYVTLLELDSKMENCIVTNDDIMYHEAVVDYIIVTGEIDLVESSILNTYSGLYCDIVEDFEDVAELVGKRELAVKKLNSINYGKYLIFNETLNIDAEYSTLKEVAEDVLGKCSNE